LEFTRTFRSFTWSNNQEVPILVVLDRVLASVEWESKFPLANLKLLPKSVSDHNPLRVCFGGSTSKKKHVVRFEKWWFEVEGFEDLVKKSLDIRCRSTKPMNIWQFKIRNLGKKLKG
jgi:hypothetical protein